METLSEAIDRLRSAGFREDFRATSGRLRAAATGAAYEPESLEIEEVVRFEGLSDPADESILFALRSRADGVKGTYTAAYGPAMDPEEVEAVRRLGKGGAVNPDPRVLRGSRDAPRHTSRRRARAPGSEPLA